MFVCFYVFVCWLKDNYDVELFGIVYLGIDVVEIIDLESKDIFFEGGLVIIMVCLMILRKNVQFCLCVFRVLVDKGVCLMVYFYGDGLFSMVIICDIEQFGLIRVVC